MQSPFFSISKHGADPNQTESEHHLTPIHVLCDAEYHGQSLRVKEEKHRSKNLISFSPLI